jgi:hypothetical protein
MRVAGLSSLRMVAFTPREGYYYYLLTYCNWAFTCGSGPTLAQTKQQREHRKYKYNTYYKNSLAHIKKTHEFKTTTVQGTHQIKFLTLISVRGCVEPSVVYANKQNNTTVLRICLSKY